jgi:hypothetical protein
VIARRDRIHPTCRPFVAFGLFLGIGNCFDRPVQGSGEGTVEGAAQGRSSPLCAEKSTSEDADRNFDR